MIWLTWRQFRVQALAVYAALLVLAAVVALTAGELADAYAASAETFLDRIGADRFDRTFYSVGAAMTYVVPAAVGAFWGAPLVAREVETGTHRLAWSQSVTRNRWLAVKLGLGMLAAAAAGALASLAMTWWSRPVDSAVSAGHETNGSIFELARIAPEMFGARGLVPIGYAAFFFALGVLLGALFRRTVPAIAVTLVVFVLIQIALPNWVRPLLMEPEVKTVAITYENLHGIMGPGPGGPEAGIDALEVEIPLPGAWVRTSETVDASGGVASTLPTWVIDCLPGPGTEAGQPTPTTTACLDRLADEGYRQEIAYYPAKDYWPLQLRETGLMLVGAALLAGLTFWRVRRLS